MVTIFHDKGKSKDQDEIFSVEKTHNQFIAG
jgi:hypothetical protein